MVNAINRPLNYTGNDLYINVLDKPYIPYEFIRSTRDIINKGYTGINIHLDNTIARYPNVLVPICGIVDYYRTERNIKIKIYENGIESDNSIISYYSINDTYSLNRPLSKIWKFNSSDVHTLCEKIIGELRKQDEFANGMLEGIEWSIDEIMDNVLVHSSIDNGFVMCQIHKQKKHITITVFDSGIGIYNSLRQSKYKCKTEKEALKLCLKEGVTRDSKIGYGNGMCGLFTLVKEGKGILNLSSGKTTYSFRNGRESFKNNTLCSYISDERGCTTVDFQLDYSTNVSIDNILTFQGKKYDFTNLFTDNLETASGILHFDVATMSEGTGTRDSAKRLKNIIMNSIKSENKCAEIDFTGINVVSSSFIDELIAKLMIDLGLFQFNKRISLQNMTPTVQKTLQKSVIQRICEEYNDKSN